MAEMSSTYAVLGGTGTMGQCLLELLDDQGVKINTFVRSKTKLEKLQPTIARKDNLQVYEGEINNTEVLADCLRGTKAAFLVVAVTGNEPGSSIAQDTASNVLVALHAIKSKDPHARLPHLVVFSSSSVSAKFSASLPFYAHQLLMLANSNIYADLAKAEEMLRAQADLVSSTFVKPGGLVLDIQHGHKLSTETQQTFVSYIDVAAGMIEVAEAENDTWDQKEVSVVSVSPAKINWLVPITLGKGLLSHFFPGYYWLWQKIPLG